MFILIYVPITTTTTTTQQPLPSLLSEELVKVTIHDFGNRFKECSLAGARENSVLCLPDDQLDLGLLLESFPAQYASDVVWSQASFCSLLQKHGRDAESASTLQRQLPPVEPEEIDVPFSVQRSYVVQSFRIERLAGLRPVKPLECAVFKLHQAQESETKRAFYLIHHSSKSNTSKHKPH